MLLRTKLDRVYEDRLSHAISGELGTTHSGELPRNLGECEPKWSVRSARAAYETARLQILELAQSAYPSYVTKNSREQARLGENSRIELHRRSRKSFAGLH